MALTTTANNLFIQNYIKKLNGIKLDHLQYVEKDLTISEKVSITFLLYGCDKVTAQIALQKLLVLYNNRDNNRDSCNSDVLFEYMKVQPNRIKIVVEALAIIKSNRVLKKLGFNLLDLKALFLPHIPETTAHIHPILKILYVMCENLTPIESGRLILDINNKKMKDKHIRCYDYSLTEIFLLDWMNNSLIDIGTWPYKADSAKPNLDILIEQLKLYEKDALTKLLVEASDRFCTQVEKLSSRSNLSIEPKIVPPSSIMPKLTVLPNSSVKPNSPMAPTNPNFSNENDCAIKVDNFQKVVSCTPNESEMYLIRKKCSGYVLIINQDEFYMESDPKYKKYLSQKPLKPRRGSDKDKKILAATFKMFKYDNIVVKDNLNHIDMMNLISDYAKRSILMDSFIVCILSHGSNGGVYGANSVFVEREEIKKLICKRELLRKPKFLILQACQGEELQIATKANDLEFDSADDETASLFADLIVASSTIPRFAAVRHIRNGSWYIQELCKKIDEMGDRKHMLEILTAVTRDVSKKRGGQNECMLPEVAHTLTKEFYLPKRFD